MIFLVEWVVSDVFCLCSLSFEYKLCFFFVEKGMNGYLVYNVYIKIIIGILLWNKKFFDWCGVRGCDCFIKVFVFFNYYVDKEKLFGWMIG